MSWQRILQLLREITKIKTNINQMVALKEIPGINQVYRIHLLTVNDLIVVDISKTQLLGNNIVFKIIANSLQL